jgi:hypothetical protein
MRLVPIGRKALVLSVVLVPAFLAATFAAPADPKAEPPKSSDKLRKDLDKPITVKIEKQPLNLAIDVLRDKSKINLVLDSITIQQQLGFTPDMAPFPVELDLKDVPLRSVLRDVLDPYGLTYVVIGDTVVLTTDEMAMMRQLRQRVNVDMDKVELAGALRQVAHDAGVNVILDTRVDKDLTAKVTLQLEDVPLETAVRLLAEMANLKPVRVGNVLFVTSKENANELRQDPDLSQPQQPLPVLKDKQ